MIPDTLLGLLLAIAGIGPGYVYTLVTERREPRPERSPLVEAVGLLVVGALTTGVSALVVLAIFQGSGWLSLDSWIDKGARYIGEEPTATLLALVLVLVVGYGFALLLALLVHRGKEPTLLPSGTAWWQAIAEAKAAGPVFATVEMKDGRLVDGYVYTYTTTDVETAQREIALQRPIFARTSARIENRTPVDVDFIVLPGGDIRYLSLKKFVSGPRSPADDHEL